MESKKFDVKAFGLTLQYEFYTFDFILKDLKEIFGKEEVQPYNMSIYKKWSQIRQGNNSETEFFTYIKFFIDIETGKTYGLIGVVLQIK